MSLVVRSVSEQVYRLVRKRILIGAIAPGMPLRQDAFALDLGVSKIPLREALWRLEQDGLVTSLPNRGFVVRGLSSKEAEEVFALRLKIEPDAVARACLVATVEDRIAARRALADLDLIQDAAENFERMSLNRTFHMTLVRPGAGQLTCRLVERLNVLAERYVHLHAETKDRRRAARREHRRLLDLWTAGRADDVAAMTRRHIDGVLNHLRIGLAR